MLSKLFPFSSVHENEFEYCMSINVASVNLDNDIIE